MERSIKARLIRRVTVRLVDFSLTGCCVGADESLQAGMVGELRIRAGHKTYHDTVHLVRSQKQIGRPDPFVLAGLFEWGNRPGSVSLRGEVPSLTGIL